MALHNPQNAMNEKNFKMGITKSSSEVISFYDRYAPTWDQRFGSRHSTQEFHRLRLDSFLRIANPKATDLLVELGVGTGTYLDVLSAKAKEIICIDGSEEMLKVLREKHRNLPNIKLLCMDLEHPQKNISFGADVVYCFGLIEHIINIDTFMLNCKSMVRKGGIIAIVTPNGKSPWYGAIRRLWRAGRHCSSDRYYTKEQLDELMTIHGFQPTEAIYWGSFPAGVGECLYKSLYLVGKLFEKTCLKKYFGGLTVSYVLKDKK
jgi:2-polyprenyl-3-methyl-5-hydroxy-6-metoxy-1,4-benzoquinol methylase